MGRPKPTRQCKGCRVHKPRSEFDRYPSVNGRMMLMGNCRPCNNPAGSKSCHRCGVLKPCSEYYELKTVRLGLPTLDNTCKNCRAKYHSQWRKQQHRRVAWAPMTDSPKKPPGWTPPPSQSELTQWYTNIVRLAREKERRRELDQKKQAWCGTGPGGTNVRPRSVLHDVQQVV